MDLLNHQKNMRRFNTVTQSIYKNVDKMKVFYYIMLPVILTGIYCLLSCSYDTVKNGKLQVITSILVRYTTVN